jgi:hypothetical protein
MDRLRNTAFRNAEIINRMVVLNRSGISTEILIR